MGAEYQAIAFGILFLACLLLGVLGKDSRPGFSDGRTDAKERWFVHSKDEYRR